MVYCLEVLMFHPMTVPFSFSRFICPSAPNLPAVLHPVVPVPAASCQHPPCSGCALQEQETKQLTDSETKDLPCSEP